MRPQFGQADLDAEIVFDRFLNDADLAVLQDELVRLAPQWLATVAGRPNADWLADMFETLCARLLPAWGHAGHAREYWAKVMSESPSIQAVGRDFGRYLPGVFWLNFFGPAYTRRIGPQRFADLPTAFVTDAATGKLVRLASDPLMWTTPDYTIDERRTRDTLGRDQFFEKS